MPRIGRVVVPGIAHHVTQRGNRGGDVFFTREDGARYLRWVRRYADEERVKVWAYCMMTNHVHLVAVPETPSELARMLRAVHMRHAQMVNERRGWQGHLWQGRFFSCALDEAHLFAAVRYVVRNPVRAGLVSRAEEYEWSSAAGNAGLREDPVLSDGCPVRAEIGDWSEWLAEPEKEAEVERLRERTARGLPCGSETFVREVEGLVGRTLGMRPRGRPRKRG